MKEAWPRTFTLALLTTAVVGGFSSTLFLTVGAFGFGRAGAVSGAGAGLAGAGAEAAGAGGGAAGAAEGVGAVFCAMTMTAVRGANAQTMQAFSFITFQVEIEFQVLSIFANGPAATRPA